MTRPYSKGTSIQLALVEDATGQEVAYVDGPAVFDIRAPEGYGILISTDQHTSKDPLWVRIVLTSGLLAAKQHCRQPDRSSKKGQNRPATFGEVIFVR